MYWYVEVLKKYATFSGRARRKEFWLFFAVSGLVSIALSMIDAAFLFIPLPRGMLEALAPAISMIPAAAATSGAFGFEPLTTLYTLATIVPGLAVLVRRLHDTDRSGWWQLIALVPIVGPIILLVFLVQDSKPEPNPYGPNPKFMVNPL